MNATELTTHSPVRLERQGNVGVIVIDNPPVNASSAAVRAGLLDAVTAVAADRNVVAAVIIGAGKGFVGGADIREFDKPIQEPGLPSVIAAIEACPKPVVAAIHGVALGGGFELALGCDARIASPDAIVGLAEVTLGIIPGAGGTQRLPRLTGIARAIELIATGRRVTADEALQRGLIDAIEDGDLRAAAVKFAGAVTGKNVVAQNQVPPEDAAAIEAAAAEQTRKARGRETVLAAIAAVRSAGTVPIAEALAADRATFLRLKDGEEAAALRYLFFAERAARKIDGIDDADALSVKTVGIVGAGTMGVGIAVAFASHGFAVTLVDTSAEALERARGNIDRMLKETAANQAGIVTFRTELSALSTCDLIVEAVFENMAVKKDVMSKLAGIAKPTAILATNTSYLDVDAIAAATGAPERVLGLHFFAPADRMRLLEIAKGVSTGNRTLATGIAIGKRLGKIAVPTGVGEGFIGNRIYAKYRAQCEFMLGEGALPHEVDSAVESLGFAMGPFAVSDLSGLDVAWRMRQSKAARRDPRERYVVVADRLCERGRLCRKTGAGWYDYPEGTRDRVPSELVARVIAENRPAGLAPRPVAAEEIRRRVLGTIVNEAACILEDRVARATGDIDLVLVYGYGFSRFKGGPLFQASRMRRAEVASTIDEVAAAIGFGFRRGNLDLLSLG